MSNTIEVACAKCDTIQHVELGGPAHQYVEPDSLDEVHFRCVSCDLWQGYRLRLNGDDPADRVREAPGIDFAELVGRRVALHVEGGDNVVGTLTAADARWARLEEPIPAIPPERADYTRARVVGRARVAGSPVLAALVPVSSIHLVYLLGEAR